MAKFNDWLRARQLFSITLTSLHRGYLFQDAIRPTVNILGEILNRVEKAMNPGIHNLYGKKYRGQEWPEARETMEVEVVHSLVETG